MSNPAMQKILLESIEKLMASVSQDDAEAVLAKLGVAAPEGGKSAREIQVMQAAAEHLDTLGISAKSGRVSLTELNAALDKVYPLDDSRMSRDRAVTRRIALKTTLRRAGYIG